MRSISSYNLEDRGLSQVAILVERDGVDIASCGVCRVERRVRRGWMRMRTMLVER